MATTWKPLELVPVEHAKYKPLSSSKPTPSHFEMPAKVPDKYYGRPNEKRPYVLYALAHLSRDDISDLLQTIKSHACECASAESPAVVRAPIYDFCSNKTLRDIYDYHLSLLDDGNRGIAYGRFIVAAHIDWETQGVLIVDFDCQPGDKGTLGMLRVDPSTLPQCLALLEVSNGIWTDLKAAELDTKWPGEIVGYSGSKWQTLGYHYYEKKWLKGDY